MCMKHIAIHNGCTVFINWPLRGTCYGAVRFKYSLYTTVVGTWERSGNEIGNWYGNRRSCDGDFTPRCVYKMSSFLADVVDHSILCGSREVYFFLTSSARVHSDSRRSSPKVADSRRSSQTEKFAQRRKSSLMPCGLRALNVHVKKLTFELSLDNDIKQPQDGPFGW